MKAGNTAPAIGSKMLTQSLLSIGLPILILPMVAAVVYFGFRYLKSRKNAAKDVEQGALAKLSDEGSSSSESGSFDFQLTPALSMNSVHVARPI